MSMTPIETWQGADLSQVGPIYPMVGTEFILWIIGIVFVLAFFIIQSRIEKDEMEADETAAKSPERLKRVFDAGSGRISSFHTDRITSAFGPTFL